MGLARGGRRAVRLGIDNATWSATATDPRRCTGGFPDVAAGMRD